MEIAMIGDQIMPIDQAQIGAHERGIFFGDGVYEVLRMCNGRLFALDRHLARLERSLREMDMLEAVDLGQIRERIERAATQVDLPDVVIYLHITRGQQMRHHTYDASLRPSFFLTAKKNTNIYTPTVAAITHPDQRWKRCDIKSLNLLPNVMAKQAANRVDAYEAILIDDHGLITEGSSTNVFIVQDRLLSTPSLTANILPGITRGLIMEWAPELGLETQEKSFSTAEALQADELFICGTISEIRSVVQLDGQPIGQGRQGPIGAALQQRLRQAMDPNAKPE